MTTAQSFCRRVLLFGVAAGLLGPAVPSSSIGQAEAASQRATARKAVRAKAVRPSAEPRLKEDQYGRFVPDLGAAAAIIYKPETGEVLWEENSLDQRSMASITKSMTALVFMADEPDLDEEVVVTRADVHRASVTYLRPGERVSHRDLLHLLLIASDNGAARVLARTARGGSEGFISRMNEQAAAMGLTSTTFVDPSGLNAGNVSSAYDISRLIVRAAADERLAGIMRKPSYSFSTSGRKRITIRNTNKLLGSGDLVVEGGKTGFIRKAGFCLATLLRLPQGDQVAVVVLGAKTSAARFLETQRLFNWIASTAQLFTSVAAQPE